MNEQNMTEQAEKTNQPMKEAQMKGQGMKSMREMAARVTRHHLEPLPESHPLQPDPFPAPVMRALGFGALGGLVLGVVWSLLLLNNLVTVPGWDNLYSMTPFTFSVFWAVIGTAVGGLLAGVAAILAAKDVEMDHGPMEGEHQGPKG